MHCHVMKQGGERFCKQAELTWVGEKFAVVRDTTSDVPHWYTSPSGSENRGRHTNHVRHSTGGQYYERLLPRAQHGMRMSVIRGERSAIYCADVTFGDWREWRKRGIEKAWRNARELERREVDMGERNGCLRRHEAPRIFITQI